MEQEQSFLEKKSFISRQELVLYERSSFYCNMYRKSLT